MSAEGGLARNSSGSAGKRGSKASGQGVPNEDQARKSDTAALANSKSGEAAERGSNRGSLAEGRRSSAGQPRGSRGSRGSQARGSQGSVGQRVSFGEEGDAARGVRSSQGRMSRRLSSRLYTGEIAGEYDDYPEEHGEDCDCADCVCPPAEDEEEVIIEEKPATPPTPEELGDQYQLDEFMRAKTYFQQVSSKSGLSLYDHLSDVIRKFLDERAPNNPVDYLEEVSMNVKRYRFGLKKEDTLQDLFYISEGVLSDAQRLLQYWKNFAKWNDENKINGDPGEGAILPGGSFQNLLRLQYYLEQVNIGLSREEMFRLALGIKELHGSRPQIGRLRFWGKIFGTQRNYYVVEAELKFGGTDQAMDLWQPKEEENNEVELQIQKRLSDAAIKGLEMDAVQTFDRAKDVVLNRDFLQTYAKTSGLTPDKQADLLPKTEMMPAVWEGEDAPPSPIAFDDAISEGRADAMKWEGYQQELMQNFPQTKANEQTETPPEPDGSGVNRRVFYVCNELGEDWALLPAVTPAQINSSRSTRWFLTGNLDSVVKSIPPFPGKEGHYLKTLLVRITAGSMASPKGYFKHRPAEGEIPGEEEDDEELEPEDSEPPRSGNDAVQPVKKYHAAMKALTNPNLSFWVHHTAFILPQGRTTWWNPAASRGKRRNTSEYESENEDSEMEDEDEDEEEMETPGREIPPPLFQPISEDKAGDGNGPWSLITSSTVFPEFQVVSVRSNVWPGSYAICTSKGKVANVYLGDGLKFSPISYCPPLMDVAAKEYKAGPELEETQDPSVETEQAWLDKLALKEIEDIEAKFVDNEEGVVTGEEEDEESDYEY